MHRRYRDSTNMVAVSKCHGYRWIIAIACFVSNFLTFGYIYGAMSIMPLYYQKQYGERTLSTTIGTLQLALSLLGGKSIFFKKIYPILLMIHTSLSAQTVVACVSVALRLGSHLSNDFL